MTGRLKGKVAIITGASRGIGAAIAKRLASEGAKVALTARTVEPGTSKLAGSLNEVADWIRSRGHECICIGAHLAKEEERSRIVAQTLEHFGGVDILVNNAAWCRYQLSHEQSLKDIRQTYEINVIAPLQLTQQCLPSMRERGGGWVVNLSSATVQRPGPAPYDFQERYTRFHLDDGPSVYAGSKAALERLTTGMAIELAGFNVAVNTVAPVEAVATEGAVNFGTIDAGAHIEPSEAMAEAVLELSTRPAAQLSGRTVLSLDLLRELGIHDVRTLDGSATLPGYTF